MKTSNVHLASGDTELLYAMNTSLMNSLNFTVCLDYFQSNNQQLPNIRDQVQL